MVLLKMQNLKKFQKKIKAKYFVIATGGIEKIRDFYYGLKKIMKISWMKDYP